MAKTSKLLNNLKVVLDGLENDFFEENENKMYYNGLEFTRSDWRNLQRAVDQVIKHYDSNLKSSVKFINNHKEYNKIRRMIHYYKSKPVKTERDFVRLEKLQKKLEKYLDKLDEERKINTKLKLMQKETEREKRKYQLSGRSIDDEFK